MPQIGPLEIALVLGVCAIATAMIFSRGGRNPAAGALAGLILGPVGVALALLLVPPVTRANRLDS